jgi:hypothetical protein
VLAAGVLALAALTATAAPAVVPAGPVNAAVAAATTSGSLSVSPDSYVPGQAVRFRGRLGATSRRVHLQSHMNRPGGFWVDVPNSTFRTDARGHFDFRFRAPAMVNLSYRVAGGALVTPSYLFDAIPQEVTLTPPGGDPDYPFYRVRAGATFTVVADTTPQVAGSWGTPPPIPGRTVLLQERLSPTRWRTIDTGTTDAEGEVSFTVTAPTSGSRVVRARQQRWTVGANRIGWFASFPAYFIVDGAETVDQPATRATSGSSTSHSAYRPTAAQRFRWGPKRFDYAWEGGQDLGSPPSKGAVRTGRWRSASDGTGRVTPFNGGLVLQSKFKRRGPGDRGSVVATLHRAAMAHGRWEFRLQGRLWETGARPYRFRLELVPAGVPVAGCAPEAVVLADFTMGAPGMRFGVRSRDAELVWRRTLPDVQLAEEPFNVAVEIGHRHITWFRDSTPIGTVKDRRAQLGVKLVPRLSLVGDQVEMNAAQVNSDWQRSWTLRAGDHVKNAPALGRTRYSGC